ncbi:hypothetical protein JAAARDRAFT_32549 [Jaapia argillacea MUCL 33604]|uniref:Uncharacterized protein n=1 Tax=Jaapia argillacea MUCL 33604 TaxID=933084 RepID=A0A067QC53_9AGAM|nr:hypothetical protein JAAARDRAFT_32549 [Jaapia argillacea MUCL 33604]
MKYVEFGVGRSYSTSKQLGVGRWTPQQSPPSERGSKADLPQVRYQGTKETYSACTVAMVCGDLADSAGN